MGYSLKDYEELDTQGLGRDFASPVVKTPLFQCRGPRSLVGEQRYHHASRHDQKVRKNNSRGGGGGHALWGSIPASGPKTCQYASQLLRTSNTGTARSGALASKDAALGSAPSFENPSSSCLSDSRNNFQRLSLQLPCSSPGEAEAKVTSPWALSAAELGSPAPRWEGACAYCLHTQGLPHTWAASGTHRLSPRTHCVCDMSKRVRDPKSQENKVPVTSQAPGCVRGKYTD